MCEHDLKIYAQSHDGSLYYFRDDRGNEIDAAAEELLKMKDIMQKEATAPSVLCVICGMSNIAYKRKDSVFVVSITALRN